MNSQDTDGKCKTPNSYAGLFSTPNTTVVYMTTHLAFRLPDIIETNILSNYNVRRILLIATGLIQDVCVL